MAYRFSAEHLPIAQQVHLLDSLKMDGMILQIETNTLGTLHRYYQTAEVKASKFHIYDVSTSVSLGDGCYCKTSPTGNYRSHLLKNSATRNGAPSTLLWGAE
jgi:hypothetical protein